MGDRSTPASPPARPGRQVLAVAHGRTGSRLELVASGDGTCDLLIDGQPVVVRWAMEQAMATYVRMTVPTSSWPWFGPIS